MYSKLVYKPKIYRSLKMKILVYPSHHALPFCSPGEDKSNTCIQVLDPEALDQWKYYEFNNGKFISFLDRPMYPLFKALVELEGFSDVVAHISFDIDQNTLECEKNHVKCWIQFSTMPEFNEGIPQVFSFEGKSLVADLWIVENTTCSPYQFLHSRSQIFDRSLHTISFWSHWLINILIDHSKDRLKEANQQIEKANKEIALFANFPKKEDVYL
jgi:hypothetical protein